MPPRAPTSNAPAPASRTRSKGSVDAIAQQEAAAGPVVESPEYLAYMSRPNKAVPAQANEALKRKWDLPKVDTGVKGRAAIRKIQDELRARRGAERGATLEVQVARRHLQRQTQTEPTQAANEAAQVQLDRALETLRTATRQGPVGPKVEDVPMSDKVFGILELRAGGKNKAVNGDIFRAVLGEGEEQVERRFRWESTLPEGTSLQDLWFGTELEKVGDRWQMRTEGDVVWKIGPQDKVGREKVSIRAINKALRSLKPTAHPESDPSRPSTSTASSALSPDLSHANKYMMQYRDVDVVVAGIERFLPTENKWATVLLLKCTEMMMNRLVSLDDVVGSYAKEGVKVINDPAVKLVLNVLLQSLEGLMVVHNAGWLHLDFKAPNILVTSTTTADGAIKLTQDSQARIIDWEGAVPIVSKVADRAALNGMTPQWMSLRMAKALFPDTPLNKKMLRKGRTEEWSEKEWDRMEKLCEEGRKVCPAPFDDYWSWGLSALHALESLTTGAGTDTPANQDQNGYYGWLVFGEEDTPMTGQFFEIVLDQEVAREQEAILKHDFAEWMPAVEVPEPWLDLIGACLVKYEVFDITALHAALDKVKAIVI